MPYVMGIDLGRTRTAAAVCTRGADGWAEPRVVPLDDGAGWIESRLYVGPDGSARAGREIRRFEDPDRVAAGFLDRVGDPVPMALGDDGYAAETVAAALICWVVDRVADLYGEPAERITVAHPPGWGGHRRGALLDALDVVELPGVLLVPNVVAAAESAPPIEPGSVLAVGRIGGEHSEAALVRRTPVGFELLAHAASPDSEAGNRIDDLLLDHIGNREARAAAIAAKERLPVEPVAVIGEARVTRAEFEVLARPVLTAAVARLARLAAPVPGTDLAGTLLVGGTARIPALGAIAAAELPGRLLADPDPGTAICRGAAVAGLPRLPPEPAHVPVSAEPEDIEVPEPPPRPPVDVLPLEPPKRFGGRRRRTRTDAGTAPAEEKSSP